MKSLLKKIYQTRFYPVLLWAGHLALLGTVIYFIDFYNQEELKNILKKWVPWNLKLNFFLILAGIIVCHHDLRNTFKKFKNLKGICLLLLFIFAFSLTSLGVPRTHRIFYDEDIYANIGQNIALANQTGYCNYGTFEYDEYYPHWTSYNKEPSGWPYLISLVFKLFGIDEFYAFILNNLIFSASVLLVFFITRYLTGNDVAAFLAGLALAIIPHNLIWANTIAAEPAAAFFSGLTVLLLIIFFRTSKDRHLFLLALVIPLASQMRPESILILPFSITAFIVFSPRTLITRKVGTYAIFMAAFFIPVLLHIYAVSGHSWGAEGAKFSLKFFENNIGVNGIYYLSNKEFPVLLTVLAVAGLLWTRYSLKWRLIILGWFLLFWGIFLFFYAGSYHYGADIRFALLSFMPLSVLAGMGGYWIRNRIIATMPGNRPLTTPNDQSATRNQHLATGLVILAMLFSFVQFLPLIRRVGQEAWGSRYDHQFAKEFIEKIPRRSIVLTQNPTMFLLWGQNAIQTYAGINHPDLIRHLMEKYQGQVYFHYNYWCNTKSERNQRLCRSIKEKYLLQEIAVACEQDYEYGLYKMSLKDRSWGYPGIIKTTIVSHSKIDRKGNIELAGQIINAGNAPAYRVTATVFMADWAEKYDNLGDNPPGGQIRFKTQYHNPDLKPGQYIAVIRVHFEEQGGTGHRVYHFLPIAYQPDRIINGQPGLSIEVKPSIFNTRTLGGMKGKINLILTNGHPGPITPTVAFYLPDGFHTPIGMIRPKLLPAEKKNLKIPLIMEKSIRQDNSYVAVVQYEQDGIHYSQKINGQILVRDRPVYFRWYVLIASISWIILLSVTYYLPLTSDL